MAGRTTHVLRLGGLLGVLVLVSVLISRAAKPDTPTLATPGMPLTTDWSDRHLIFSQPTSEEQGSYPVWPGIHATGDRCSDTLGC